MSQENVEIVRRAIEGLNDWKLDPECFDPDVEYTTQPDAPMLRTYHGMAGLERSQQSVKEAWKSIRAEPREFIEGEDVVVAVTHFKLHGHSGVELEVDQGWAYWMRDGKIRRMEQYGTREQALEAARLSE